ncbi:MAG: transcriptional regulator [Candidatus Nitrosothermus koennekii]|nr:MAG: transcriptional regulator [Candidatus Nitrosothermus koennekii]
MSLSPTGREEIHKLEYTLLINSIFREDVLEALRDPKERVTWIDSLAVAAAALAREKAKMTVSEIADELGRTTATIRNHLQGKTKAGQIVIDTYNKFVKEGVKLHLEDLININQFKTRLEEMEKELEKEKARREVLEKTIDEMKQKLKEMIDKLESL